MKKTASLYPSKSYLDYYLSFLKLEIPNILQIVGFITFFGLISSNSYFKIIAFLTMTCLVNFYLIEKFFVFAKKDITESIIWGENVNMSLLLKETLKYRQITVIISGVIETLLFHFVKLN